MLVCFVCLETANREKNYVAQSQNFQSHAKKMADTATALAKSGVVKDRQLADELIKTAKKVGGAWLHSGWRLVYVTRVRYTYILATVTERKVDYACSVPILF